MFEKLQIITIIDHTINDPQLLNIRDKIEK